jgi:phosphohistidine phosphatase
MGPFGMQRSLRGATVGDVRRLLIVVRHAKAEPFAESDQQRRLTDRGHEAARDAGRHLRETGVRPDFALVSTAVRTRETWADLAEGAGVDPGVASFDDALFTGSVDMVLDALHAIPEDVSTAVFVGHNPTAAYLGHMLDDGEGDPEMVARMLRGFPPAALTVLEVTVPWSQLGPETGRVVDHVVGGD